MSQLLLCWVGESLSIVAKEAKGAFSVQKEDRLYTKSVKFHRKYATFDLFRQEVLIKSTEALFSIEPATKVMSTFPVPYSSSDAITPSGPAWPHTHTIDVHGSDVYCETEQGLCRIDEVTINGFLQWQRSKQVLYYIMSEVPGGEAFAGALIAIGNRDGEMTALVFSPKDRNIGVNIVRLADKHLNCIRGLKIDQPRAAEE